jgi:hypothetical protein
VKKLFSTPGGVERHARTQVHPKEMSWACLLAFKEEKARQQVYRTDGFWLFYCSFRDTVCFTVPTATIKAIRRSCRCSELAQYKRVSLGKLPQNLYAGRQHSCFTATLSDFIEWIDLSFPDTEPKLRRGNVSLMILYFALTLEMSRTSLAVSSTGSDVERCAFIRGLLDSICNSQWEPQSSYRRQKASTIMLPTQYTMYFQRRSRHISLDANTNIADHSGRAV